MTEAFRILGYPTFHGRDLYAKIGEGRMWEQAFQAKFFPTRSKSKAFGRSEFDQLLGPYAAVADTPAVCFGTDLIEAYPEAKVILVERGMESWYKSYYDVIISHTFHPLANFASMLESEIARPSVRNSHAIAKGFFHANSREEYAKNARTIFQEHYREIRKVTAETRLLEFDLKQGWAPLCEFLGKPIPDVAFPRTNERELNAERRKIIQRRVMRKLLRNLFILFCAILLLGCSLKYLLHSTYCQTYILT